MIKQEFFLDTSNLDEIKRWKGIIRGVTTNQMIMYKEGVRDIDKQIKKICKLVPEYPVSVELMDSLASTKELIKEATRLSSLGDNVVVKVPITDAYIEEPFNPVESSTKMIELVNELVTRNIPVNVTAMITDMQMKMAVAATQASKKNCFVSLFWARNIDDQSNRENQHKEESILGQSWVNKNPGEIVKSVRQFIGDSPQPRIIIGSIRTVSQVEEASVAGADIVTVTPKVFRAGLYNRTTLKTVREFDEAGQGILMYSVHEKK